MAVSLTSDPGEDGVYDEGETIAVTVVFSEAVTVDTESGTPAIGLLAGGNARQAVYASGSSTRSLVFAYEVTAEDGAPGEVLVTPDSLALNGGTIRSGSGLDATLAHLGAGAGHGGGERRARHCRWAMRGCGRRRARCSSSR